MHKEIPEEENRIGREIVINVAGYNVRLDSDDYDLIPGKRFLNFIEHSGSFARPQTEDFVRIKIHSGMMDIPQEAKCVFHAPLVEEADGLVCEKDKEFWSIWKNGSDLFIETIFPLSEGNKKGLLKFSLHTNEWKLWIANSEKKTDPLEYPLDGLILYYLSVINRDIMIHASGVSFNGKGYLFCGVSGRGKTTMTKLWQDAGATVIHDDRLIVRRREGRLRMFNTPVYENEVPSETGINAVFLIDHGRENITRKLSGASAVSAVMTNCIQHNWEHEIISDLLASVMDLCSEVPVCKLSFIPDKSVINHILNG